MRQAYGIGVVLVLLQLAPHVGGQTISASYSYDANGCRVMAAVVYLQRSAPPVPAQDTLAVDGRRLTLTVHPNPTTGMLTVTIPAASAPTGEGVPTLTVRDIRGALVYEARRAGAESAIDLQGQPDGVYLLTVEICGEISTFKVVKRQ